MWIVNALSVCSEMLKLSRNNQNNKMLGVPPNTLPLVIYIGIFCYWELLRYNMSVKTIAGGFNGAFWWFGPLSEDWFFFFFTNPPKLSCGFNTVKLPLWLFHRIDDPFLSGAVARGLLPCKMWPIFVSKSLTGNCLCLKNLWNSL